ncbi:MAG: hypothetical protein IJ870_01240 [Alphaproteobacteria bacterium]|nr:hypothetical protein [Alphaproteobacteria bacterium]
MKPIFWALIFLPVCTHAAENVDIYGSAQTASGKPDTASFSFEEQQTPPPQLVNEPTQ